jgi:hypothetical protein
VASEAVWRFAAVLAALSVLPALSGAAAGADYAQLRHGYPGPRRADPYVYVPVPPPSDVNQQRGVQFFGRNRVEVPGAVTVNTPPYVCDPDGRTFDDKQSFVAHLRTTHDSELRESTAPFVVDAGQVHFTGK